MTVQIKNNPSLSNLKNNLSQNKMEKKVGGQSSKFAEMLKRENPSSAEKTSQSPRQEYKPPVSENKTSSMNNSAPLLRREPTFLAKKGTVADLQAQLEAPKSSAKAGGAQLNGQQQMIGEQPLRGGTELSKKAALDPKMAKELGKELNLDTDLKKLQNTPDKLSLEGASMAAAQAQQLQGPQGPAPTGTVIHVEGKGIPTQMLDKIVENVRVGFNEVGAPEFQFDLKGDVLGGLKMRISFENGALKAIFVAENPEVKKFMDTNLQQLEKSLHERGIVIKELEVRDPEEDRRQRQREQSQRDRQEAMEQF